MNAFPSLRLLSLNKNFRITGPLPSSWGGTSTSMRKLEVRLLRLPTATALVLLPTSTSFSRDWHAPHFYCIMLVQHRAFAGPAALS